jgi:chemotaxis protein CheD
MSDESFFLRPRPMALLQGEAHASADPQCELSTVLGSCVAACLYDPEARIGGMNHFLLGEPAVTRPEQVVDEHYGVYLMEVLINDMLKLGARRNKMRAHLYGGASMHARLGDIGTRNAQFARKFLATEAIPVVREDVLGTQARRVHFRPASGQVRVIHVPEAQAPPPVARPNPQPAVTSGEVEFF